jgi:HEAT repeat protein
MKTRAFVCLLVFSAICFAAAYCLADTIKLKNGETHRGEITKETETSVILRMQDGGIKVLSRSEIAEIIRGEVKKPRETEKAKPEEKASPKEKPGETREKTESPEQKLDVVVMRDGTVHNCIITNENERFITIRKSTGFEVLRKEDIRKITRASKDKKKDKPGDKNGEKKAPPPVPANDVTSILDKLTGKKPISEEEAVKRIVKLGPEALYTLFRLLERQLSSAELRVVARAIAQLRDEDTVGRLKNLLSSESKTSQLNAIAALGGISDPDAIGVLLKYMLGEDVDLSAAADRAVAATLRREPNNHKIFMTVHDAARSAQNNGKTRIARVLGGSGSRLAVSPLLNLVSDWNSSVKVAAVIAIGRLGFNDHNTCNEVRRLLTNEDTQVKREAALALGRLQDLESVEDLIAFLRDENRGIRKNAHWALKNITGLRFQDNYTRWKVWWDRRAKEARKNRETLLTTLRSGTNDEKLKAIGKLSAMRLGRKQIASVLMEQFSSGDKRIRIKACESLAAMNARSAVPGLIRQLNDIDPDVQKAAHSALKTITGQKLALDLKQWEKWHRSSNW